MSSTAVAGTGTEFAVGFTQMLIGSLKNELATTRKVIAAVPEDKSKHSYRPDPKAKTAWELAWHIASSDVWFLRGVAAQSFALEEEQKIEKEYTPKSIADMVRWYHEETDKALAKVAALAPEKLAQPVQFFMWNMPNYSYLMFCQSHMAHHRGQLSTYLRPMGSKVPSIYGGSADEPFNG